MTNSCIALNLVTFNPLGSTPSSSTELDEHDTPRDRFRKFFKLTGFPLEKVFTLVRRNMTNRRKDVRAMSRTSLNTISMINSPLSRFVVDIEVSQIVVEVN